MRTELCCDHYIYESLYYTYDLFLTENLTITTWDVCLKSLICGINYLLICFFRISELSTVSKTNCSLSSLCDQEKALCLIVILKLTRWCLQENCNRDKTLNVHWLSSPRKMNLLDFCPPRMFTHLLSAFDVVCNYHIQLVHISLNQQNKNMYYTFFLILQVHRIHIFATCTIHHKKTTKMRGYRISVRPMDPMRIWKKHLKIFRLAVSPCRLNFFGNSWKLGEGNSGWLCWSEWLFFIFWAKLGTFLNLKRMLGGFPSLFTI